MYRLLALLIGIPIGILIIKYREKIWQLTGSIELAERYLGEGGTFTIYLLLGVIIVSISILYAIGALQIMLQSLGSLFPFI